MNWMYLDPCMRIMLLDALCVISARQRHKALLYLVQYCGVCEH